MRILHSSDWHLGRSFGDHSLQTEQERFVDWLVELARSERPEVVAIAGDLHDRSAPPVEAVALLSDALRRLRDTGAQVVAIAGNHDSAGRVAAFDGLVDAGGVHMRGGYGGATEVRTLETAAGPLSVVAVPFLDPLLAPAAVRAEIAEQRAEEGRRRLDHGEVLAWALARARATLPAASPSLVLSHAFVTGGTVSDSERELSVGTAGQVPAHLFEGFDYVALGHLHRPQPVGDTGRIRYSGSPLAYSFSEEHDKEVVWVELDGAGQTRARGIPVDVGRRVRTVRGAFLELLEADGIDDAWVRVELTDGAPVVDAHRRLRERFPHLVEIARTPSEVAARDDASLDVETIRERDPRDLAASFWEEMTGEAPDAEERALLDDAVAVATREAGE